MAGGLPYQDASALALRIFAGIRVGNKRSHKLPFERVPKPPPNGSNALFIGLLANLAVHQISVKKITVSMLRLAAMSRFRMDSGP